MPSRTVETALRDMLHHIDLAMTFASGFDRATFSRDVKTIYAVTRCLEIISEASRRLSDELKSRHQAINWKQIASAGNIYRHEYEDVVPSLLWDTVHNALPQLRTAVKFEMDHE